MMEEHTDSNETCTDASNGTDLGSYLNKPMPQWKVEDIVEWARNDLKFEEKSLSILRTLRASGDFLLTHQSVFAVFEEFEGIPKYALRRLYAEIEKFQKEFGSPMSLAYLQRLGFVTISASEVFLNLCTHKIIRFEPLPLEDRMLEPISSTWLKMHKEIPPIDPQATRAELTTKISTFVEKFTAEDPEARFWIYDRDHNKGGKKFRKWHQRLFIIEVANVSEFAELNRDEIDEKSILQASIKKRIGQLTSNILKNLSRSVATKGYGAVTCYSHWIFVTAFLNGNEPCFIVHNRIEKLDPDDCKVKNQKPFLRLPSDNVNVLIFPIMIITEDYSELVLVAQVVTMNKRSLILSTYWQHVNKVICIKCDLSTSDFSKKEADTLRTLNEAKVSNVPQLLFSGEFEWAGKKNRCFATDSFGECVPGILPLSEVHIMIQDVLKALAGMHALKMVHSDVKTTNIVREWDPVLQRYKYTLIDFGFSFVEGTASDSNWGLSDEYASLEVLEGNAPTMRDDLKSLWYTMIHVLNGTLPWAVFRGDRRVTQCVKAAWHSFDLAELGAEDEIYGRLITLYKAMDTLPDPHEAWQQYLMGSDIDGSTRPLEGGLLE